MKRFILILFILISFTGCFSSNKITFPNISENIVSDKQKNVFFDKLVENNKNFNNVRVLSDVILIEKGEGFKFRYLFIYDKNLSDKKEFVRIEAFPPETFLSLHILTQNENNKNLTKDNVNNYDFYILENKDYKLLQIVSKNKNEYYEFNLKDLSLVTYDNWKDNGQELIMRIKKSNNALYVIIPQNELLMNFFVTKKEYDVNVKQDVFNIKIPKNYKVYKR